MSLAVYQPQGMLAERSTFEVMPMAIDLADRLAMTDFVPKGLRGNKPAIMAAILAGHEVGLPPMASLAHINVIEGRPTLDAAAQRALILSHGHELGFTEMTVTRCVMWGRRKGGQQVTEVTWTMDDAKRAGLAAKQNWTRHPSDMLVARATGKLARAIFADVIVGIPYNREELEDGEESGAPLPGTDTPPPPQGGTRRRRADRAATEPPPAPPLPPASEGQPPDPSQEPAGAPLPDASMPLNQQIAMVCRELDIDRKVLIKSLTGTERGSDLTREQAVNVLEMARAIQRGEMELIVNDQEEWSVVPVGGPPDLELDLPGDEA